MCYYCTYKTKSYEEVVDHAVTYHSNELLKYRIWSVFVQKGEYYPSNSCKSSQKTPDYLFNE